MTDVATINDILDALSAIRKGQLWAAILGAVISIMLLIGIAVIAALIVWYKMKKGAVDSPTAMEAVKSLMGTKIKIGETKSQPAFFTVNETGEVGVMVTIMGIGRINLDVTVIRSNKTREKKVPCCNSIESLLVAGSVPSKRLLFLGAPGTGKTCFVELLAAKTNSIVLKINAQEFFKRTGYESFSVKRGNALTQLIRSIGEKANVILFIDEIDKVTRGGFIHLLMSASL